MEEETVAEEKIDFAKVQEHLIEYLKIRLKSFQLTVIEYIAKMIPVFVFVGLLALVLMLFWVFANIAAAIAIGDALEDKSIGFLIVSGFNLLLAGLITLTYKPLIYKPVSNWMVKILMRSLEQDEIEQQEYDK